MVKHDMHHTVYGIVVTYIICGGRQPETIPHRLIFVGHSIVPEPTLISIMRNNMVHIIFFTHMKFLVENEGEPQKK
jgi:hypothetical protein